jgi:anti-anti-sigma factor
VSTPTRQPGHAFHGVVEVDGNGALLTVRGEIDIEVVPEFQDLLAEAVGIGGRRLTVDMTDLRFLDASGLDVLADAARRLRITGGRMDVRGVPPHVFRLFDIAGLAGMLRVTPSPAPSGVLAHALAGAASPTNGSDVLDAALRLVVTMAQAVVRGADGASITLPRGGRLGTVAASNDVVLDMDNDQYDTGQGPCLDAARSGERFHIESLDDEARWPAFVPRARARGIRSIMSTPLLTAGRPMGALNIYSRAIDAFAAHEQQWADQFAVEAAHVIGSSRTDAAVTAMTADLVKALESREVIALAQGVVMHRDGLSPAAAHAALVRVSRRTSQPLREVCRDLVTSMQTAAARSRGEAGSHDQPSD